MNGSALRSLRKKLSSNQEALGLWITLESPSISEIAVAMGLDWIVIDAEHGHLDWSEITAHLRSTVRSETVALVRLTENSPSLIKRALDVGADGVVIPWMEERAELEKAVRASHYPPEGMRGIGAERATCWGKCFPKHVEEAEESVMIAPIIESVRGAQNAAELVAVDGVDLFFFGPADLSATAGYPGQWEGPGVPELIRDAREKILAAGKNCGVVCTDPQNMADRREQGFRLLGLGLDAGLLVNGMNAMLEGGSTGMRQMNPSFEPEDVPPAINYKGQPTLSCAPEHMRPDRMEVVNQPGEGPRIEIARGVEFDCMVGAHNQANNLTTGLVHFLPGAELPYHRHTFEETVTLLSGRMLFEVEGRMYDLNPLDNISLPAGLAHRAVNIDMREPAVCHVAMRTTTPDRELVETFFSKRRMGFKTMTQPTGERITRIADAKRYSPGENASFVDYFNEALIPGYGLSGGYGLFTTGGRLPAHLHDFDESICIVQGSATCIVEGRTHQMAEPATALQPRGRIHYFINKSPDPMAMIWVYAGPMPERIIVEDDCADVPGVAWGEACAASSR